MLGILVLGILMLVVGSVVLVDGGILVVNMVVVVVGINIVVTVIINVLVDVGVLSIATRVFVTSIVRVMSVVLISAMVTVKFVISIVMLIEESLIMGILVVASVILSKVVCDDVDMTIEDELLVFCCAAAFRWLLKTTSNDSTKTVHFMLPSIWNTNYNKYKLLLTKTQLEVNNNVSFSIREL